MELKEYQRRVLEKFDTFLSTLRQERDDAIDYYEFQKSKGRETELQDYSRSAWEKIKSILPRVRDKNGSLYIPPFVARYDARKRSVPHICLKVPTGGGKTLLAAECVGRLQTDFFKRQTGLVLWVVPTVQIYTQTKKALFNRLHPYRQSLERASGGRVKVLEKDDPFTKSDTENFLCVMLVRLAATNRKNDTQFLKIFRDAGRYATFFPESDDYTANNALLNAYPDLEVNNMADAGAIVGVSIKQSLVNTLKMLRPVVVIDEGHKAYSENTRESLNGFNPSFILELSATPNVKNLISNVLVDVSGVDLKDEQMIKLPINIANTQNGDWKNTLTLAHGRLAELGQKAIELQSKDGRYIRPIMVVRVERTGKDQRDGQKIHALDARDYLIERLSVHEDEIRIKSSETDELGDTDLFDPLCPVKYIITKEALQEGWDCSFAYVLALLDKTTAQTAMTQMIGRVLRQPDARSTRIEALNQCYVFCYDQNVTDAVENVRKGLEEEGMTGLGEFVRVDGAGSQGAEEIADLLKIRRNSKFDGLKIFLPKVLHRDGNDWRDISYERDILSQIPWETLTYDVSTFLDSKDASIAMEISIDVKGKNDLTGEQGALELVSSAPKMLEVWVEKRLDIGFLTRPLLDVVPNPWQASRILMEAIDALNKKGHSEEVIFNNRLYLLDSIKRSLKGQVHELSEKVFMGKLKSGDITFRLITSGNENLNFEIAQELQVTARKNERKLRQANNDPVTNSLFEIVFEKDLNNLEKDFALYLSGQEAVQWWHRMVVRQEYALQGWQRNKVYPDFIACLNKKRMMVLETKGLQLKGNDDTVYKARLFDLLTNHYQEAIKAGTIELSGEADVPVSLHMLMEDNWKEEMITLLS
ncbi:MAG: DEAD/DEAH box helicase family protein [Alphaproteobacteria bacterium]|nr:DEAD/DEAH box helicase family protein [Alphaproteobacteria bacterium]